MADSDGEYVAEDLSDDEIGAHDVGGGTGHHGTRSRAKGNIGSGKRAGDREGRSNRRKAAWEDIQRSWDTVVEGADGSINSTVEGLREAGKRKRHVIPFHT
jgi:transcription initiation factor TFIIH subunit 2